MSERNDLTSSQLIGAEKYLVLGARMHLKAEHFEVDPKMELKTKGRVDLGAKGALQLGYPTRRDLGSPRKPR